MTPIRFTVYGDAKPAGSKRAFVNPRTGKPIVTDDSGKAGKDWRRNVSAAAAEVAPDELLRGALAVTFLFYRPRPKSHFRTGANAHLLRDSAPRDPITRPDVLKLARAVEDACTGIIWHDDSQIVSEHLYKAYGDSARTVVQVEAIEDAEPVVSSLRAEGACAA